jgi:hypothetical protein
MPTKKINSDLEVQGDATVDSLKTPTGTSSQTFLADGQITEIDSWSTNDW